MATTERKPPIIALVAIGFMVLAGILYLVAMALPYWHVAYGITPSGALTPRLGHYGLWVGCEPFLSSVICAHQSLHIDSWLLWVRALHTIGMMCGTGALIMMVVYAFIYSERWSGIFKISAVVSAICAGLFVMIGDVVYGASISQGKSHPMQPPIRYDRYKFDLSWSFGLSVTAAILCIVSAVCIGFAKKRRISN
ncbi:hypothetical protein FSP39_024937 [Pinctada imbricata]|uniref:Uncharacterized protein n=1 Tax=Pinctada imbricata TaxID=66713 RepID=A0AA89CAC5_PINIB|nr:hypothetical protein FSP39_024937 [Pinctada imbricata]